jgi:hypothetical protein
MPSTKRKPARAAARKPTQRRTQTSGKIKKSASSRGGHKCDEYAAFERGYNYAKRVVKAGGRL